MRLPGHDGEETVVEQLQGVVKGVVLRDPPCLVVRDDGGKSEELPREVVELMDQELLRLPLGPLVVIREAVCIVQGGFPDDARPHARRVDSAQDRHCLQRSATLGEGQQLGGALCIHETGSLLVDVEPCYSRPVNDGPDALWTDGMKGVLFGQVAPDVGDGAVRRT